MNKGEMAEYLLENRYPRKMAISNKGRIARLTSKIGIGPVIHIEAIGSLRSNYDDESWEIVEE